MATISVLPPFVVFNDTEGESLEDGFIYIGTTGLNPLITANQLAVYADFALTIPVATPIRTNGGYPVNSGSPIRMYVGASDYSIVVLDKNGGLVYVSLSNKTTLGTINLSTDVTGLLLSSFIKYDVTTWETAAGVAPVSTQYWFGHAWRHLTAIQIVDVIAGTLLQDVTTALQTWGNLCISSGVNGYLPEGSYATSSELLFNLPGNRTNQSFAFHGDGEGKTRICRIGSQTSVLKFFGGGGPSEANLLLEDFAVVADQVGAATILRNANGVTIQDCAIWTLRNIRTQYCQYNLLIDGSLIGSVEDCNLSDGRVGIKTTNTGGGAYSDCNSITISGRTLIKNNFEYGCDVGFSSMFYVSPGANIERNGIAAAAVTISNASPAVVTYVGSGLLVNMPVVFTTTGGLPTGLTAGTTYFVKTVLTANTFTVSATIGGVAINTSSAGSGVHTCTPQTHGVIVRSTCDDLIGVAAVHIEGTWFELNVGGWGVFAEALGGCALTVQRCEMLQTNAIKVTSGTSVAVRDMVSSASAIYDITCTFGELRNFSCNTLIDGITYPDFVNFRTATQEHANGRVTTYVGTLTDCTTAPTGTINLLQRGKTISISLQSALTAASATVAAPTITGMGVLTRPAANKTMIGVNTDASVDKASQVTVLTTGVISLANGFSGAFTAAGIKGSQFFRGDYEIA